jgi:hypothetical protein
MTDQIPVKAVRTGSTVTALAEFESGDKIPAAYLAGGTSTTAVTFGSTADGNVQSNTVVCATADGVANPDLTDANDVLAIVGIASTAANDGSALTVMTAGTLTESGWSWTEGPVYCAVSGGALTQTVPATGAVVQVAVATSATTVQVGVQRPAILRN